VEFDKIDMLSQKIYSLMELCRCLRQENRELKDREVFNEKKVNNNELAYAKIEAVIKQLDELEREN